MRSEDLKLRTKRLAVSALLIALAEVILALGAVSGIADLTAVAVAACFPVYAAIEMTSGYAWSIWFATSGLAWLLLPVKETALLYTALGYYALIKRAAERLPRVGEWLLKLLWVSASGAAVLLVSHYLLTPGADAESRLWMIALFGVAALGAFFLYDVLLTRLITLYLVKWRERFRIR